MTLETKTKPIPLIAGLKSIVPYVESNITQALGFFGSVWYGRKELLDAVAAGAAKANLTYKEGKCKHNQSTNAVVS